MDEIPAWKTQEYIIDQKKRTSFEETSLLEIDQRFAEENPDHPDSREFFAINRERCSELAEALLRLIEPMIPSQRISSSGAQAAGRQMYVLLWLLQSGKNDIGKLSMADIALKLGCTRSLLSNYAKRIEARFGYHGRGMKGKEASKVYLESSRRGWETRRKRQHGEKPEDEVQNFCDLEADEEQIEDGDFPEDEDP
jgi:DNA-binding MarR family transcriptional regulator